ncbi:MAG TPA: hypothetical protein VHK69_10215 [Chitinophagaceae bacterium]|jgi:hypothetical protein|nr:hypothetical protein [Chitinophagaceae bacterium]
MEKQLTITIPNASGEEGLTQACKRGELFRHDEQLDPYYRQGYRIHDYALVNDQRSSASSQEAVVRVYLRK